MNLNRFFVVLMCAFFLLALFSSTCLAVTPEQFNLFKRVFSKVNVEYHGASQFLPRNWAHDIHFDATDNSMNFPPDMGLPLDKDDEDESYLKIFLSPGPVAKKHEWMIQIEKVPNTTDTTIKFTTTYTAPAGKVTVCTQIEELKGTTDDKPAKIKGVTGDGKECNLRYDARWISGWEAVTNLVPDADVSIRRIKFPSTFILSFAAEVLESENASALTSVFETVDEVNKVVRTWNLKSPEDFVEYNTQYAVPLGDTFFLFDRDTELITPEEVGLVKGYIKQISGYEAWQPGIKFDTEGKKAPREYLILRDKEPVFLIFADDSGNIQAYNVRQGYEGRSILDDEFKKSGKLNRLKITTWDGWNRQTPNSRQDTVGTIESALGWITIGGLFNTGIAYGTTKVNAYRFRKNIRDVFKYAAKNPVSGEALLYHTSGILHDGTYTVGKLTKGNQVGPKALEGALKHSRIGAKVTEVTSTVGKPALRVTAKAGLTALSKIIFVIAIAAELANLEAKFAANKFIFVGKSDDRTKMFFHWNEDVGHIEGRVMFLAVTTFATEAEVSPPPDDGGPVTGAPPPVPKPVTTNMCDDCGGIMQCLACMDQKFACEVFNQCPEGVTFESTADVQALYNQYKPGHPQLTMETTQTIANYANQYGVPVHLAMAVAEQESGFQPCIMGDGGHSLGMYQILDTGAYTLCKSKFFGNKPFSEVKAGLTSKTNCHVDEIAQCGIWYLRYLYDGFHKKNCGTGDWYRALCGYNTGNCSTTCGYKPKVLAHCGNQCLAPTTIVAAPPADGIVPSTTGVKKKF